MENVTILFAFTAGVLSFLSPCIFPLIPAYIANLTGSHIETGRVVVSKKVLMARSIYFILGFSVIFMLMGASASALGQLFSEHRGLLEKISGFLIIVFGMQMAGILTLKFLMFEKRVHVDSTDKKSNWSSFVLGLAFGTGWTPCVGLALSSILLLAGSAETMYSGLFLLMIYSLGLGIPFLLISWMVTYSLGVVRKVNKLLPKLSLINGWILIVMGLLLFTGQLQKISAWFTRRRKKMVKNIIAVMALLGLIIWGVYDSGKDNNLMESKSGAIEDRTQEQVDAPVGIQQGNVAPDFELKTLDGESIKLSDFRGKRVILNMWATWCPPCRAEMPDMESFYEANKGNDVVILGVNLTSSEKQPENIAKFMEEFGITFPVVLDEKNAVADQYQVVSIPTSYMIDSRGVIQQRIVGPMNKEMMEELVFSME